jgi:hypothetical protein
MVEYLEMFIRNILKLPLFPDHWGTYFYEYSNLRKFGYPRKEAREQAIKKTICKYRNDVDLFVPNEPILISTETIEATSEAEAALKTANIHLDNVLSTDSYRTVRESNGSVLLIQTRHKMGKLTYNLKEPLRFEPPQNIINICRFEARRTEKDTYEVTQKFLSSEDRLTTPILFSPGLQ